jgi:hypothetical protein
VGFRGVDAGEVDVEDDELVENGYSDHRHGHGDLDVPSTLRPARKYICPARLGGNTPASGEIYFRRGLGLICFRASSSVYIIMHEPFRRQTSELLVSIPRPQDTLHQTPITLLKQRKHAPSPLPLPSPIHRRRGRQDPRKTRRTRAHPARWDVAQRSERGRWVEHVCRRSEDEDESER